MSKTKIVLTLSIFILISTACAAVSPIAPTAVERITPTQTQAIPTAAPTQTQPPAFIPQTADQVARISLNEAKSAFDNNSAVFVDTRSQQAYQASHIKGALAIGDFESSPLSLDKHQWIITYCT